MLEAFCTSPMLSFPPTLVKNGSFTVQVYVGHCRCPVCLQIINGEMYPPSVAETNVNMNYPASVPTEKQMAIGQEVFGLLPGLSMYATLWLREHNRVCDILKKEHPTWEDEQLFQTTRLIIIGEVVPQPFLLKINRNQKWI